MYLYGFRDLEDIAYSFRVSEKDLGEVLFASYDTPPYEGYAFVLTKIDGKLYEVHGSHCSCFGLEDQWRPESCTKDDLMFRINQSGFIASGVDICELRKILDGIEG